jgi:hypothetical protein
MYSTNDGYKTGCYNNNPSSGTCVPFIIEPNAQFTPGQVLSTSGTPLGVDQSAVVRIKKRQSLSFPLNAWVNVGWEVSISQSTVGYYPIANFSGTMQVAASSFQVGGEVADLSNSWVVPMGNGASPFASSASYQKDFTACTGMGANTATGCSSDFGAPSATVPSAYNANPNGSTLYFGDVGGVFWNQDYGTSFSAVGDWDAGFYKGECGSGWPVDGVSKFQSGPRAHAVHCSEHQAQATANQCYARLVQSSDNRGDTDNGWDWDPGSFKTECNAGEYVQGVAQDTGGAGVHSILCCPSNVRHLTCTTQTFYSADSSDYSGTDWDPAFFKGQCQPGEYVAGISTPASTSVGAAGAPHAILCCIQ